jgi:hypothetical protein
VALVPDHGTRRQRQIDHPRVRYLRHSPIWLVPAVLGWSQSVLITLRRGTLVSIQGCLTPVQWLSSDLRVGSHQLSAHQPTVALDMTRSRIKGETA